MRTRGAKARRREVVWSANFAYAVGLMTADGSLSKDGRHLVFVSKDKELIKYLKKAFHITAIATHKAVGESKDLYYRLQWGDIFLYRFFVAIGLTPRKSLTIGALKIPDQYFFDFLRGLFDGDGSFYSYFDPRWKRSFMFYISFVSGSRKFISWLQNNLEKYANVQGHVVANKTKSFFQLRYAKAESLVVMTRMYSVRPEFFLKRKRLKIERALRIVGESL